MKENEKYIYNCPHCGAKLDDSNLKEERVQKDIYGLYLDEEGNLTSDFQETNYDDGQCSTTYFCADCCKDLDLTDEEVIKI